MSSNHAERLRRALEQLQADESLTANLTDSTAETIYPVLEQELESAADLDDAAFAARVVELRRATKAAARAHGDSLPALLTAIEPVLQMEAPPANPSSPPRSTPAVRRRTRRRRRGWSRKVGRR